jgi:3-methyladenine DNA glycosylase AlkD
MSLDRIRRELREAADERRAAKLKSFFKTGPGEYAEGDSFLGINVPRLRKMVRGTKGLELREIADLLRSPVHEERLLALLILIERFRKGDEKERGRIFNLYVKHLEYVNNWDLVDVSAGHIIGTYLEKRRKDLLVRLARSKNLWHRRVAMIATFPYIRKNRYAVSLRIARMLLQDDEDLIHKAVGWMLREIGKRDMPVEEEFLRKHYRKMPRTMLRYAIERFPEKKRLAYLHGRI